MRSQRIRQLIREKYPKWHDKPFRLNIDELKKPELVIKDFFSAYSQQNIRVVLQEWCREALMAEECPEMNYYTLYENVDKLIEAIYTLYWKRLNPFKKKKNRK